jgi:hypothetical protein
MAHQPRQVAFDGRPPLWWGLMGVALLLLCATVAQAAPANDEIAHATVIPALPFTDGPLGTTAATPAASDPDCFSWGTGPTVWYVFTPTTDLSIIVDTFGSNYDTTLSVYTGAPGALTPLTCAHNSQVVFPAVDGTTYYIMVGSFAGGPGSSLRFHAAETEPRLGASVFGIIPSMAVCRNVTTGQQVTLSSPAPTWDCEVAGLPVSSGDRVTMRVHGTVWAGATDVGGAVTSMVPTSGGCTNVTTGQRAKFQHMVGATVASCVAAGLVVQPWETVQMNVQGAAE